MNKYPRVVSGNKEMMAYLDSLDSHIRKQVKRSLADTSKKALDVAKTKLLQADHTQKYGDLLVKEVGMKTDGKVVTIYAPYRTNTSEMRKQMYYAEYGAGVTTKQWRYHTTPNDKSRELPIDEKGRVIGSRKESYHYQTKKGTWIGVTDRSKPVKYMAGARHFIIINARGDIINKVNYVIGRKYSRYKKSNDDESDGVEE